MISTATQRGRASIRGLTQNQPQKRRRSQVLQHSGGQENNIKGTQTGNTKCNWPGKMFSRLFSRHQEARQRGSWVIGISDPMPPAREAPAFAPYSWEHPTRVKEPSPSRHRAFTRRNGGELHPRRNLRRQSGHGQQRRPLGQGDRRPVQPRCVFLPRSQHAGQPDRRAHPVMMRKGPLQTDAGA
jgi:hypothetical protein